MKIAQSGFGAALAALFFAGTVHAQNVGLGFSNPQSQLAVNGNLAIGTDYNLPAPANGALVEGYVGIGTTSPIAPLHVGAIGTVQEKNLAASFFQALDTQLRTTPSDTHPNPVSAVFASLVYTAGQFVAYSGGLTASDARLKNVIGRSDSAKDLETLKSIEVTDYTLKDTVTYGNKPFKKVIAQQVEQVYPTAVKIVCVKGFTFLPDIYAASSSVKEEKSGVYKISLAKAHSLKDGDTVRLITSKNPELSLVAHVVNDKTFTVETKQPLDDKVFVYGKECTDLKAVDYDAISMLNVSATQELAKKVESLEARNSELESQSKRLSALEEQERAEIAALKAENEKLTAIANELTALKKSVATMQEKRNGVVETVALGE
jgi:Chaperone of endosialidase